MIQMRKSLKKSEDLERLHNFYSFQRSCSEICEIDTLWNRDMYSNSVESAIKRFWVILEGSENGESAGSLLKASSKMPTAELRRWILPNDRGLSDSSVIPRRFLGDSDSKISEIPIWIRIHNYRHSRWVRDGSSGHSLRMHRAWRDNLNIPNLEFHCSLTVLSSPEIFRLKTKLNVWIAKWFKDAKRRENN